MAIKAETKAAPAATTEKTETKRDRFVRLVAARMSKALLAIELVGGLANKANYDFEAVDVNKIKVAFDNEVAATMGEFADALAGKKTTAKAKGFTL